MSDAPPIPLAFDKMLAQYNGFLAYAFDVSVKSMTLLLAGIAAYYAFNKDDPQKCNDLAGWLTYIGVLVFVAVGFHGWAQWQSMKRCKHILPGLAQAARTQHGIEDLTSIGILPNEHRRRIILWAAMFTVIALVFVVNTGRCHIGRGLASIPGVRDWLPPCDCTHHGKSPVCSPP